MKLYQEGDIDALLVREELSANNPENLDVVEYLQKILNSVPSTANAGYYAKIIKDKSDYRKIIQATADMDAVLSDNTNSPEEQVEKIQRIALSLPQVQKMNHVHHLKSASEIALLLSQNGNLDLVPTGYSNIDYYIAGVAPGEMICLAGRPGMGKCLGRGTGVMKYDGSICSVECIKKDDLLMGPDSRPRRVLSTTQGCDLMYKIIPTKGEPYFVNSSHILSLRMNGACGWKKNKEVVNVSINDYLSWPKRIRHHAKGWRAELDFKKQDVNLEPYYLGLWLGDGTSKRTAITTMDKEVIDFLYSYAAKLKLAIRVNLKKGTEAKTLAFSSGNMGRGKPKANSVLYHLAQYNLLRNKHIPLSYKINDRDTRLELLAGIVDTDGYLVSGCYEIATVSAKLADDYLWLARSLGFAAYKHISRKTIKSTGFSGNYWRIFISGDISEIPVRILRKKANNRKIDKNVTNYGIKVEPHKNDEYFGFELDGDGLFLLGDFTVTHNSGLALNMAVNMAKKGKSIVYITLEMTGASLIERAIAGEGKVNLRLIKVTNPAQENLNKFYAASMELEKLDMTLREDITTVERLLSVIELQNQIKPVDCVFVDYIQLMSAGEKNRSRYEEVTKISGSIKRAAMRLHIPIVAISQLNRAGEGRTDRKPRISDLRDSGAIEQDADIILLLHREDYYRPRDAEKDGLAEVDIAKNRRGPTGWAKLMFLEEYVLFGDYREI
jgi:replicative DNA helicase